MIGNEYMKFIKDLFRFPSFQTYRIIMPEISIEKWQIIKNLYRFQKHVGPIEHFLMVAIGSCFVDLVLTWWELHKRKPSLNIVSKLFYHFKIYKYVFIKVVEERKKLIFLDGLTVFTKFLVSRGIKQEYQIPFAKFLELNAKNDIAFMTEEKLNFYFQLFLDSRQKKG